MIETTNKKNGIPTIIVACTTKPPTNSLPVKRLYYHYQLKMKICKMRYYKFYTMRRSTLVTKLTFRMLKMESQRGYVEKIFTLSELYTT